MLRLEVPLWRTVSLSRLCQLPRSSFKAAFPEPMPTKGCLPDPSRPSDGVAVAAMGGHELVDGLGPCLEIAAPKVPQPCHYRIPHQAPPRNDEVSSPWRGPSDRPQRARTGCTLQRWHRDRCSMSEAPRAP